MKIRKEYLILSALIIALSAYILTKSADRTHYTLPVMEELEISAITAIQIDAQGKSLKLNKQYDNWFVGPDNFPASDSKIKAMLSTITGLKLTALVSESRNYGRYELDEPHRISVSALASDKVLRKFDIGKTASSYRHTFVRLDGNNGVYHAEENFRNRFPVEASDLTDKNVLRFTAEGITEISAQSGEQALALKKEAPAPGEGEADQAEPAWKTDAGASRESQAVTEFLNTFASLNCKNYVSGTPKASLTTPLHTVTVKGDKSYSLSIYPAKEGEETFTATSSEREIPFSLASDTVEKIATQLDNLRKEAEPAS